MIHSQASGHGIRGLAISLILAVGLLCMPSFAHAGLHYRGETWNELPCQWRGLINDLRTLRNIAVKPGGNVAVSPLRETYQAEATRLKDAARLRPLEADELADLGVLQLRLGEVEAALETLRTAQRLHPRHFAIASNLGTAWQLQGDLDQAAEALRSAIDLAPEKLRKAEEAQLRLIKLRQREERGSQQLDDLFGIKYVGLSGAFEPGRLSDAERKKLPTDAIAQVQRLALVLPADARLIWQLGELANAHGDVRIASELYENCVAMFGLGAPELRERRLLAREAATQLAKAEAKGQEAVKTEHNVHAAAFNPKSKRALAVKPLDLAHLPPITKDGLNPVPWALLLETQVDRNFRPTFPRHLQSLRDHQVTLSGFMQPLTDEAELSALMLIEYPTGCWYCEMPEVSGIVLVELPDGKAVPYTRNLVKVTGKLSLNATDPENFLYTIKDARVVESD